MGAAHERVLRRSVCWPLTKERALADLRHYINGLSVWLLIWADNTLHIIINGLAIHFAG